MPYSSGLEVVTCSSLPGDAREDRVYRLEPSHTDRAYYQERIDRNIGWITREEQDLLERSVVGIAGCGGMGGLLASIFLRLGVGEVRIADCEVFDISNINRQFAAGRETVGKSKAFETARMIRAITDDTTLVVYPQGISPATATPFLEGCDIVCDEIEFWAVGARILLHEWAQQLGVPLINCSTVGFGTRLFLFDHRGMDMGTMFGLSLREAGELQQRIQARTATKDEVRRVMNSVLRALIPEVPEYGLPADSYRSAEVSVRRLLEESRAPIIATNPPLASGFAADHTLLALLQKNGVPRNIVRPPKTPGYLYFDAALMRAQAVERTEVSHE